MAKKKKAKETDAGTLGRLSKAGEDALTRLVEELGKNERVTDAVGRAMAAKGKLDDGAKRAVGQVGLAAAEELKDLRKHIERLEKRLAKLEADASPSRSEAANDQAADDHDHHACEEAARRPKPPPAPASRPLAPESGSRSAEGHDLERRRASSPAARRPAPPAPASPSDDDAAPAQRLRLRMREVRSAVDLRERQREVAARDVPDHEDVEEAVVRLGVRGHGHAASQVAAVGDDRVVQEARAPLVVDLDLHLGGVPAGEDGRVA